MDWHIHYYIYLMSRRVDCMVSDNDDDNDKAAGFVIMSSVCQAKQGRRSCRLVREQVMMATDDDDEISEHGLLGWSRILFKTKTLKNNLGSCLLRNHVCIDMLCQCEQAPRSHSYLFIA